MPIMKNGRWVATQGELRDPNSKHFSGSSSALPQIGPSAPSLMNTARGLTQASGKSMGRARGAIGGMSRYAGQAGALGSQLAGQYRQNFAPAMNQMAANAVIPIGSYVNQAANDVGSNYARQRGMMTRNLGRMGLDPTQGKYASAMAGLARGEAASRAGAMTRARMQGQAANFGRLGQVANVGQGLAGMARAGYGQAMGGYGNAAQLDTGIAKLQSQTASNAALAALQQQEAQAGAARASQNQGQSGRVAAFLNSLFGPDKQAQGAQEAQGNAPASTPSPQDNRPLGEFRMPSFGLGSYVQRQPDGAITNYPQAKYPLPMGSTPPGQDWDPWY